MPIDGPLDYPPARRDDLVEELHGVAVADPYRWLESPDDPDTRAWIAAQNELTERVLHDHAIGTRQSLYALDGLGARHTPTDYRTLAHRPLYLPSPWLGSASTT